jgi:hypothetical protein
MHSRDPENVRLFPRCSKEILLLKYFPREVATPDTVSLSPVLDAASCQLNLPLELVPAVFGPKRQSTHYQALNFHPVQT